MPQSILDRDPLALAMFAAWCGVSVDQLPETMRAHTCEATAVAWERVANAARMHIINERFMAEFKRAAGDLALHGLKSRDEADAFGRLTYYLTGDGLRALARKIWP